MTDTCAVCGADLRLIRTASLNDLYVVELFRCPADGCRAGGDRTLDRTTDATINEQGPALAGDRR